MNPISCDDVRLLLSLYIENMLSEEEMTQVREHLAECDSCKEEYALLKGIMRTAGELPEVEVSEAFAAKLHSRLEEAATAVREATEQQPQNRRRSAVRWRIVTTAAAGAAVIALSVVALNRLPDAGKLAQPEQTTATASPDAGTPAREENAEENKQNTEQDTEQQTEQLAEKTAAPSATAAPPQREQNTPEKQTEGASSVREPEQTREEESPTAERAPTAQPVPAPAAPEPAASVQTNGKSTAEKEESEMQDAAAGIAASEAPHVFSATPAPTNETAEDSGSAGGAGGGSSVRRASGGGSSPSISGQSRKRTVTVRFTEAGLARAREILSELPAENGGYRVSEAQLSSYVQRLQSVDGYVSSSTDWAEGQDGDGEGSAYIIIES